MDGNIIFLTLIKTMRTHRILLFVLFIGLTLNAIGQSAKSLVDETVHKEKIEAAISFIAADEMRGRDTPSSELDIAAKYLATFMYGEGVKHAPGMDSYFQDVPMRWTLTPNEGGLKAGNKDFMMGKDLMYLDGPAGEFNGELVYLGYGREEDFAGKNVKGKVVVVDVGMPEWNTPDAGFRNADVKVKRAMRHGAVALIELYGFKELSFKVLVEYMGRGSRIELDMNSGHGRSEIPYLWLDASDEKTAEFLKSHKENVELVLDGHFAISFTTRNVIGYVEGGDPKLKEEIVIYSAHYDHIGVGEVDMHGDSIYNGTRDNAVGTVTVMEAARNIAKYPLKRSAMFIFFTGEEQGLLGSEWYVEHPVVPLEKVVYCFNSDNAGYNDTTAVTIIGLERTTASKQLKDACAAYGLRTTGDPAPEQNLFDRSDQVSFAQKGVPALMYSMGMKDFGDEILKHYHRQSDNPDSVDYDYLYKFTKAYVLGCRLVGDMKERPYWVKGDRYYEAGEHLYKR